MNQTTERGTALKKDLQEIERATRALTIAAQKFQPFYDALARNGYACDLEQFKELVYNKASGKKTDALDTYLREKTVKMHPAIDSLPIEHYSKCNMIKLPEETMEIVAAYNALPGKLGESVLRLVYSMEIVQGQVKPTEAAIQAATDKFTVFGGPKAVEAVNELEKFLQHGRDIQKKFGIDPFRSGVLQFWSISGPESLNDANLNIEKVIYQTNQHN